MRVTHPFHPLNGRRLVCVGKRYNRYGTRLLLRVDNDSICSVPPQWTDLVAAAPEVVLSGGRAAFRFGDLLDLSELIARLLERVDPTDTCKDNNAARVSPNTPLPHSKRPSVAPHDVNAAHSCVANGLDASTASGGISVTESAEVPCRDLATGAAR